MSERVVLSVSELAFSYNGSQRMVLQDLSLEIPAGTVKSRLFKARAELKRAWDRLNDNPTWR